MSTLLKKGLLAAFGAWILTKGALENAVSTLVKEGKLDPESSRTAKDLIENVKKDIELLHIKGIKKAEELTASAGLVVRNEYEMLEKRVTDLELTLQRNQEGR